MLNEVRRKPEKPRVHWNGATASWYCTGSEGRSSYSHSPAAAEGRYFSQYHGIPYMPQPRPQGHN